MMVSLALRLLPVWRWIKANPLLCLCAVLALWGAWERSGRLKALDQRNECRAASQTAAAQTKTMREQERRQYEEKARHADQEHNEALADARAAADAYIRSHRVRPSGYQRPAEPISQAGVAAEPSPVPSAGFVAVSDADVQACTAATVYAVTAHNYLLEITER